MYSALKTTVKNSQINEKTTNAKIVAVISAKGSQMQSVKVTYDFNCNIKMITSDNSVYTTIASGATTVDYKEFKW